MQSPLFATFAPAPLLAPYIDCYWLLRLPAGHDQQPHDMPADGRIELIFNFADGARRTDAAGGQTCTVETHSYMLGTRTEGYRFEQVGQTDYVVARFKPGGLSAFTSLPLTELSDIYLDLDRLWPAALVRRLEQQLYEADSPAAQVYLLETALLARLRPPDHLRRILYAVEQLESPDLAPALAGLANELHLSQKHFERLFARYVGFRPSLFGRIARFQRAVAALMTTGSTRLLTHVAVDLGYYDQAHFAREFKQFSGVSPSQFLTRSHGYIEIAAPAREVDFIQADAG